MTKIRVTRQQYERIKFAYRISGFVLILLVLFAYSLLINKTIEFVCIFLPYFFTKGLYSHQWHSKSMKECMLLSIGIFAFAISITMTKTFSITFSLLMGILMAYISCKAGIIKFKLEDYAFIEPRYNKLVAWYNEINKPKSFHTDTCTIDELINRCNELGFSKENTNLAIEFFINKTKQSVLADNLCIEEVSVARKKLRLKQKLNKIT
jgi:hypothetical protein